MTRRAIVVLGCIASALMLPRLAPAKDIAVPVVRIAALRIDPAQVERYTAAVKAEIEASVRLEPGVLAICCAAEKGDPTMLRLFEVYADEAACDAYIASPHFRTHAEATKDMIASKQLIETTPVQLSVKP